MSAAASLRCPQCAAHVPAGAQWCTLCYADLRPAPEVTPTDEATQDAAGALAHEPVTELPVSPAAEAAATSSRGKHARRSSGTSSADEVESVAASMLAELAASTTSPVGRWSGLTDTTGKKVALMLGGATVVMVAFFLLMAALGALL